MVEFQYIYDMYKTPECGKNKGQFGEEKGAKQNLCQKNWWGIAPIAVMRSRSRLICRNFPACIAAGGVILIYCVTNRISTRRIWRHWPLSSPEH